MSDVFAIVYSYLLINRSDEGVTRHSFIVSPTAHEEVKPWRGGKSISNFNEHNVYFMNEQKESYVAEILKEKAVG